MMTQAVKRLSRYDIIMKRAPDRTFEMTEDFLCKGCCHYRPDWKYRFCEFLECPYVKGQKTFLGRGAEGCQAIKNTTG